MMSSAQKVLALKKAEIGACEADIQAGAAILLDDLRLVWCHVGNGGYRHKRVARKLRQEGVKAGVPDILIFTKPPYRPGVSGVAIELKTQKGRTSKLQKEWLRYLYECGWISLVCFGFGQFEICIRSLGYQYITTDERRDRVNAVKDFNSCVYPR